MLGRTKQRVQPVRAQFTPVNDRFGGIHSIARKRRSQVRTDAALALAESEQVRFVPQSVGIPKP